MGETKIFYLVTDGEPKAPRILFRSDTREPAENFLRDHITALGEPESYISLGLTCVWEPGERPDHISDWIGGMVGKNIHTVARYTTPEWYEETFPND